jgi:hypothetical protein
MKSDLPKFWILDFSAMSKKQNSPEIDNRRDKLEWLTDYAMFLLWVRYLTSKVQYCDVGLDPNRHLTDGFDMQDKTENWFDSLYAPAEPKAHAGWVGNS